MKRKALHLNSSLTRNAVITNKSIYGANHIVVEGAGSIIADTVMNRILYPRDEVEALAARTNGDIHAPSGHPQDEKGNFIPAGHPMATQQNFIGGISNNYRMNGDRLVRDIAINPEIANRSDDGKEIIRRIDANEDTDTSTGLLLQLEEKSGIGADGEEFDFIARNMELDHDAILLRERGAATTLQGVGMFANSAGDEFSIDEVTINESMIASNLPLAPNDHVWNESEAIERIKAFTNSKDKPSSNFRRFFLNFDRKRVDEFSAYTNAFADIIDGKPHAVKQPLQQATNSDHAKAYLTRFETNSKGVLSKAWNVIKSIFTNGEHELSHDQIQDKIFKKLNEGRLDDQRHLWPVEVFDDNFIYHDGNDKLFRQSYALVDDDVVFVGDRTEVERVVEYKTVTNNNGDSTMLDRKQVIALLAGKNISVNADISDADLEAKLTEAINAKADPAPNVNADDQPKGLTLEDVTAAINAGLKPLQEQLTANADKEQSELAGQVVKLDIGIDEEAAKAMSVNALNSVLAKNGKPAFNSGGRPHHQSNADDNGLDNELPE
jgi:hypothetical protein